MAMKNRLFILLLSSIVIGFTACNKTTQTSMMKNVTGKAGELVVVIAPNAWDGAPGIKIQEILGQSQLGLPQGEPIFDLINIPLEAFGDIFKTTRNLLVTSISSSVSENKIAFMRDVDAYTQAVVYLNAKSQNDFVQLFTENADKIVGFFMKAERDRLLLNYSKYNGKAVSDATKEVFGININVPPGFNVAEKNDSFMWIRFETPAISQGILIYSYPYTDENTFSANYMLAKRNIELRNNVPGPTDGSYMTTENAVPVIFNTLKKDGNYAAEMRGLWKVENDFMGGPFISLSMLDLLNNRVLTLDGYIYAPSKDKRNFLRQVEAMIYSATFINQKDMDKINAQFNE